jgi:lipopolysaccharide export system permease protein
MTILYRYVTREILQCFLIVLATVLSIYLAIDFIEKIDNFMEAGVPAVRCVVYLLYKLPFIIVQIAPVGFLLAILIALGLMSKNNEVIALKSCGIGNVHLLRPSIVLGVFFCAGLFIMAEMMVPRFMVSANQIWLQEVRKKNVVTSRTNDIWMRAARQIIHIKQYDPQQRKISGITIYTFDEHFSLMERLDARTGNFADGNWRLDGVIRLVFDDTDGSQKTSYDATLTADIDLSPEDLSAVVKRSDEMGLAELGEYIEKVEREGYGATRYRVDYHSKIAAPFVTLFLSVLGVGIVLRGKLREGISVSVTYGLGIAFLYWIFNSFCMSLGYAGMIPPLISAWLANLVFFCTAALLFLRAE